MTNETQQDASYNPATKLFAAMMAAVDSYAVTAYDGSNFCKDEEDTPAGEKRQEFYC